VSYDLRVIGSGAPLTPAWEALGGTDDDELLWTRGELAAQMLLTSEEIGVGVVGDGEREFEELLRELLRLADDVGARVHDPQFGRDIGVADVPDVVEFFAG
jgi:hypothetical protein